MDISADRLYILPKENVKDGKVLYEYRGSMLSNLEDKTTDFLEAFLPIATHYTVPSDETIDGGITQLKKQLDENDRALMFKGMEAV